MAAETGANTGAFRLTRSGSTTLLTSPLTVTFTLTGTATNGTDYQNVPLTATFLANQATVDVLVTPIVDATTEGSESAILTLTTVAPYDLGAPATATVSSAVETIHDNLQKGEDPSVSRNGHWFNVTGFRATPDGGRMTVTDPLTGESKTVNARHFLNNAEAVTFDKTDLSQKGGGGMPTQTELARPKHERPGGGGKIGASSNPVED